MTSLFARLCGAAMLVLSGAWQPARALVLNVGNGCDYSDLQAAVTAAPATGGEIHLSKNLTNQHVDINTKSLVITGGFATCAGATPTPGASNVVSAGSHTDDSVITIRGSSDVVLQNLTISDGKETDGGYGGGIDFVGQGRLLLNRVLVQNNRAGYGGGINMSPSGATLLVLQQGSAVNYNTGTISGGGIRMQGDSHLLMTDGTASIIGNSTTGANDGHGGGLQVIGPARAEIGSGKINANSARYGGGIAVEKNGVARLFSTKPSMPAGVGGNTASRTGGGVYLNADASDGVGILCGFGYDISNNKAQEGSAIYADADNALINYDTGGLVYLTQRHRDSNSTCGTEPATTWGAVECTLDQPCNRIDANEARTADGDLTTGAAILVQSRGELYMERVQISHNLGGYVVRGYSDNHTLSDCLINNNTLSHEVAYTEEDGDIVIQRCTIAGNTFSDTPYVLSSDGDISVLESVIWQPGKSLVQDRGDARTYRNVMANEVASLGGGRADLLTVGDPKFKNPSQGNYRLAPGSPGVDFAALPSGPALTLDFDNRPRNVDLATPDRNGPLDVGVYELQTLAQFPPDEGFDAVIAPAITDGWGSSRTGGGTKFYTVTDAVVSAPNAMFTNDPQTVSDKRLSSPAFTVVAKGRLTFKQRVNLEARDGAALEIAIGAGQNTFTDILAAGGSFVGNGYNASMAGDGNPLGTRAAWSGNSGGFQTVTVNLPASADGQVVRVQWHVGTNASGIGAGYWLDDVHVDLDTRIVDRLFCGNFDTAACE